MNRQLPPGYKYSHNMSSKNFSKCKTCNGKVEIYGILYTKDIYFCDVVCYYEYINTAKQAKNE